LVLVWLVCLLLIALRVVLLPLLRRLLLTRLLLLLLVVRLPAPACATSYHIYVVVAGSGFQLAARLAAQRRRLLQLKGREL
jgi:hypothetical protein